MERYGILYKMISVRSFRVKKIDGVKGIIYENGCDNKAHI